MIVKLYKTLSEDNKLDKELTLVREININLLIRSNATAFDFSLSGDMIDINYMYIPDFGKYYFLKSPTIERKGFISYRAEEDVLMTYRDQIRQESGIILRQENEGNLYLVDGECPTENRNKIFFKEFPIGFNVGLSYYLTIGG